MKDFFAQLFGQGHAFREYGESLVMVALRGIGKPEREQGAHESSRMAVVSRDLDRFVSVRHRGGVIAWPIVQLTEQRRHPRSTVASPMVDLQSSPSAVGKPAGLGPVDTSKPGNRIRPH